MNRHSAVRTTDCFLGGFCLVTDRKVSGLTSEEMVEKALQAGGGWIQYREKERTLREMYHEAVRLRALTSEFGALFLVNDHVDLALAVGADGVHLGQDDLPLEEARRLMGDRIIGISTHSLSQAIEADRSGADYIGFGPVFPTSTKDAGEPRGLEMLKEIAGRVTIPVVAIGGISVANLTSVLEAGADAVAASSALLRGSIAENVTSFIRILRGGCNA